MYLALLPKLLRDRDRRDLHVRPPVRLVAMPMQLAMMLAAQGDGELVAHFSAQRSRLGDFEMMRITGRHPADQARLRSHEGKVGLVPFAQCPRNGDRSRDFRSLLGLRG